MMINRVGNLQVFYCNIQSVGTRGVLKKRTSFNLPADVRRPSEVRCPSYDDQHGVLVEAQIDVCGGCGARLLLDLPLRHPAGRHVGNLDVMSLKKPDSAFYDRYNSCPGMQPEHRCSHGGGTFIQM